MVVVNVSRAAYRLRKIKTEKIRLLYFDHSRKCVCPRTCQVFPSKSHEWWWDACNIFDGRPAGSAAGRSGAGAETGRFLRNAGLGWVWGLGVPISGSPCFIPKRTCHVYRIFRNRNYFLMPFNVTIINPGIRRVSNSVAGVSKIFYG